MHYRTVFRGPRPGSNKNQKRAVLSQFYNSRNRNYSEDNRPEVPGFSNTCHCGTCELNHPAKSPIQVKESIYFH